VKKVDKIIFSWDEFPSVMNLRPGTIRRTVSGINLSIAQVRVEPGTQFDGTLHAHEHEQMLLMIAGRLQLQVEDQISWIEPGQVAYFPPGSFHAAIAVGPEGAEYFEIFSPPRLDQLIGFIGPNPLTFRRK
jgi:mannose-6-phosphate isomerase-like protein (cupin superfamily)